MNTPEQLSEHFSLSEMLQSGVAVRFGIDNLPEDVASANISASDVKKNLRFLCRTVLEPLRQRVGRVLITSGYRTEALNKLVKGVANSQHLFGEAADIYVSDAHQCQKYAKINVSSTNLEQSKLCVNSPLYIDTRLLWEQTIGSNSTQ